MRITIVQHAGDYRTALLRIKETGQETYYAQRYSIEVVADLVAQGHTVTFVTAMTETRYEEVQENGVLSIGCGLPLHFDESLLTPIVAAQKPDRLIMQTPILHTMRWAAAQPFRSIAVMADSFSPEGLRGRFRNMRWGRVFRKGSFEWICNHGLNSCLSLRRLGVDADKVIPWDWPAMIKPRPDCKTLQSASQLTVLYVGMIDEKKGISDTLRAAARLKADGIEIKLRAVGGGEIERFTNIAAELGVADRVKFLGLIPHDSVLDEMRSADVVVVPSRHNYPEGFPMTIYETLCSRTPLVASDHPMFRANLKHDVDAWIFQAGNADALAEGIRTVTSDADRYRRLSAASAEAWSRLQLPVQWGELLKKWLRDTEDDRAWLYAHRLASGRYPLERFE